MLPPVTYDLAVPVSNDTSLSFFQPGDFEMPTAADFAMAHVNLTGETPLAASDAGRYAVAGSVGVDNYTHDVFDSAVSSRSAASDDFNYSTTLLTTLEHYSSASAALNHDVAPTHVSPSDELLTPPLSSNLSDTNALFQQLLRANLLLDELDFDNSSFLNHSEFCHMSFVILSHLTDPSNAEGPAYIGSMINLQAPVRWAEQWLLLAAATTVVRVNHSLECAVVICLYPLFLVLFKYLWTYGL